MSQIDTNVLLFFTYCIMMAVKMAATTAIGKFLFPDVCRT